MWMSRAKVTARSTQPEFPLGDYLDGIVNRLRELVPQAVEDGNVEAIHQARVATRRMRAALDLLAPITVEEDRRTLLRTLRRLRRRLGTLRDLDVMLGHLDELKRNRSHKPAIEWTEARLQVDRTSAAAAARDEIAPAKVLSKLGAWWGLRQQAGESRHEVDSLISSALADRCAQFADDATALCTDRKQRDPHALRISGKLLRYTLEMAAASGHALPKPALKSFKKMQDCLGLWHDFVVLTEQALHRSADEMLAHHDAAMQQSVLALARLTLQKSEQQLKKFASIWADEGASIVGSIQKMYPAGDAEPAVTQSQTGPNPASTESSEALEARQTADPAAA